MTAPQQNSTPGLFASLWRYRWLAVGIVLAVTLLSGVAGLLTRGPATATATIALKNPSTDTVLAPGISGDASTARFVEQRAQFVTNDDVLGEVVSQIDGQSVADLRERVTATPISGTNTITITAEAPTAEEAVALANATVDAYRSETAQLADDLRRQASRELLASQDALRASIGTRDDALAQASADTLSELQRQDADLRVNALLYGDGVDFVNSASTDDAEVPGLPLREIAVGLLLGVAAAAFVSWVLADRRRRVGDAAVPAAVLDAPLLGVVQRATGGRSLRSRGEAPLEATHLPMAPSSQYQLVAAALMRRSAPGIIVVLAPPGAVDRSDAALNVAVAVAADGGRVLVIDADPAQIVSSRLLAAHAHNGGDDPAGVPRPDAVPSPPAIAGPPGQNGSATRALRPSPTKRTVPAAVEADDRTAVAVGTTTGTVTADRPPDAPAAEAAVERPTVRVRAAADAELDLRVPTELSMTGAAGAAAAARRFAARLAEDRANYDVVVIDAPPLDATPLASALVRVSTGILAIVPRGSDEQSVADIRRTADIYSSPVVGFVYTGARGIA